MAGPPLMPPPPPEEMELVSKEPSPRRSQIVTFILYAIILGVVALISARAAAYDQQIGNLRQEVNNLENELETEISRLDALNLQNQKDSEDLSDRIAKLEGIHSPQCTHGKNC